MSGAHQHRAGLVAGGHTTDKVARRNAALDQMRELLGKQPMSCGGLSAALGLPSGTIYGYLRYLESEGEVYLTHMVDEEGRKTWAIDNEELRVATDRKPVDYGQRAWTVPARQMGMQRDPLVAALFGPAQGGGA